MTVGAQLIVSNTNSYPLAIAYSELPYYSIALTSPPNVHDGFYQVSFRPGLA